MKLGDVANADALKYGKPLDGVRILAIEQMQALPYGTQLLARLGADVVKVEALGTGESGRGSLPAMIDPNGQRAGATFLRNNLDKRSITVDLKHPKGRELILALAPHYDVFAENFKGGTMKRLGLDYETVAAVAPRTIYLSVSGFGVIGVLAALLHRERTGEGQYVDIAMLDAVVSMTDLVTNFWSMGARGTLGGALIMNGFRASDGFFLLQVGREHLF